MRAPATDDVRAEREGLMAEASERARQLRNLPPPAAVHFVQPFLQRTADLIETQAEEIKRLQGETISVSWGSDRYRVRGDLASIQSFVERRKAYEDRALLAEAEVARLREALEFIEVERTENGNPSNAAIIAADALQPRSPSHG